MGTEDFGDLAYINLLATIEIVSQFLVTQPDFSKLEFEKDSDVVYIKKRIESTKGLLSTLDLWSLAAKQVKIDEIPKIHQKNYRALESYFDQIYELLSSGLIASSEDWLDRIGACDEKDFPHLLDQLKRHLRETHRELEMLSKAVTQFSFSENRVVHNRVLNSSKVVKVDEITLTELFRCVCNSSCKEILVFVGTILSIPVALIAFVKFIGSHFE